MTSQWPGQGLPPAAQARIDEIRASGTWGSALSTAEFAAIKSAGFDPVGQVLGAAVYNMGYSGGYGCPSAGFGSYSRVGVSWRAAGTLLSSSAEGSLYGPVVQAMYNSRRKAISRMAAECARLGGHGVVGVRLTTGRFPAGGLECYAIGTAVRAPGVAIERSPFTSDLSGQDFAKLIADGVVPVGLALGISIGARHDDWLTWSQTRWSAGNTEVSGYTELVSTTRHDARNQLRHDVSTMGAEGVVVQRMTLRRDGSPRINPIEPYILDGHLLVGAMSWSAKAADLRRDPRYVLHSTVTGPDSGEGELKLQGVAFIAEPSLRVKAPGWWSAQPPGKAVVFELGIARALFVEWDIEHAQMTVHRWSGPDGYRHATRTYP